VLVGYPRFPAVLNPAACLVDGDGAVQVSIWVTRSFTRVAGGPIDRIDLKEANIFRSVWIVILCVGIPSALLSDDALAAALIPARVFSAHAGYIHHIAGFSTKAVVG